MRKTGWKLLPLIVFFTLAVFLWKGLSLDPQHLPSASIGKPLPDFQLPQLNNPQKIMSPASLNHQVALLNVWASWCAACIEEQVFMLQLAREGVPVYGLNYKDKREDARRWLLEWGNPYRLIAEDSAGKTAIDLGVYGAPETFLIDKHGLIRYRHVGILTEQDWKNSLQVLMKQLEHEL